MVSSKFENVVTGIFAAIVLIFLATVVTGFIYITWNMITGDTVASSGRVVVRCNP